MVKLPQHPRWLDWAQRIQSVAQAGATYTKDPYDAERYDQLRRIVVEIISEHTAVPSEVLSGIVMGEEGYLTPKVDVRAVVFNAKSEILLVREATDELWSLPGGWADVGESPGEVAAREVAEESGYMVRPCKILAVYDRARHEHPPLLWYVYKLFIQCELIGGTPRPSLETDQVGFFGRSGIPKLSVTRVTESQIRRAFEHYDNPALPTDFD